MKIAAMSSLTASAIAFAMAFAPAASAETAQGYYEAGMKLQKSLNIKGAVEQFEAAYKIDPDMVEVLAQLSWAYATSEDPSIRKPSQAVTLAERLVELTYFQQRDSRWSKPFRIANAYVLAVAYAGVGRYSRAGSLAQLAYGSAVKYSQGSPSTSATQLVAATATANALIKRAIASSSNSGGKPATASAGHMTTDAESIAACDAEEAASMAALQLPQLHAVPNLDPHAVLDNAVELASLRGDLIRQFPLVHVNLHN